MAQLLLRRAGARRQRLDRQAAGRPVAAGRRASRLVGFSTTGLLLPEALFGTAAVPLLFAAVRRIWSTAAGLAAALALALLPIEVITSRSDTMDGVMMALTVLALLCIARAARAREQRLAAAAAAAALGAGLRREAVRVAGGAAGAGAVRGLALPGSWRRRAVQLLAGGAVYVAVALAWLLATLAFPARERPFAVGSTNGSAWNAALVFNGVDRLEGKPTPGQSTTTADPPGTPPPSRYAQLTPAPARRDPAAPALGRAPARPRRAAVGRAPRAARAGRAAARPAGAGLRAARAPPPALGAPPVAAPAPPRPGAERRGRRTRRRVEPPRRRAGLAADAPRGARRAVLWLVIGTALFSQMAHLHPRYTESITPAVAGTLGIGLAWACARRTPGAPGRARGLPARARDLRRAAAVRDPAAVVGR